MFAKKVPVKFQTYCSQCCKELTIGNEMILIVYYPFFFNTFTRGMVKGEKTIKYLCLSCLDECITTIENNGQYSEEFTTMAKRKRMKAAFKNS